MQERTILVVNAGSSSLKLRAFPSGARVLVERIGDDASLESGAPPSRTQVRAEDHTAAFGVALEALAPDLEIGSIDAVGHRIVHGGTTYVEPVVVDAEVERRLERLAGLAPLHNPPNLAALRAAKERLPSVPHVAVFDTAFHARMPRRAYLYGLPLRYLDREGIRRYGFHGTSHDYVSLAAAERLGRQRSELRIVTLHLGNGASACAVDRGRSVDTSMGFTPLEGLLMGTRSGSIDPGVLLHLARRGYGTEDLDTLLNHESGLLGLSGVSNDMRDVRAAAEAGDDAATAALEVFAYRVRKVIGAYAAAMGGLDVVVFTGGIGENDAAIRRESLAGLGFLGIELDEARNLANHARIGREGAGVEVMVVATDEERMIATATTRTLRAA